ncbi:MAG: glycosyltransferase family 39 protein [Deltaproteobacteria bacterium]|nr:glycosyltransferase family 39 protein [Deltaproteobacteria bacterium]
MANSQWRDLCLILLMGLLFIFWEIGSIDLLDPDEGMYGAIAREMVEGRDWITPRFNGVRYLEKPPLYFWLTAITADVFGFSEWVVRLWTALPALGTAIITWRLGELLYGGKAGLASAVVMMSGVGVFRYVRVPATDFLLIFSISLSMYGFVKTALPGPPSTGSAQPWMFSRPLSLLFYLGIGLAVLSKGLVGLAFPLITVGLFLWFSGERMAPSRMNLRWGLLLFLALSVPWVFLSAWKNPGFFDFYIVDNQLLRFFHKRSFIEDDIPMVGIWALVVIAFFSLASFKLDHYFLPAIVPLSLMVGGLWAEACSSWRPSRPLKWCLGVTALVCVSFGAGLLFFSDLLTPGALLVGLAGLDGYYRILLHQGGEVPFASVSPFVSLLKDLGLVLVLGFPLSFILFLSRWTKASFITVLGVAGAIAMLVLQLYHVVEPHHSAKSVAQALVSRLRANDAIVYEGGLEYSGGLPFYTGRKVYVLDGKRGDLDFGSRYAEARHLFLDAAKFTLLWEGSQRVFLVNRVPMEKSALIHVPLEKVFVIGRYGSHWLYANQPLADGG